MDAIKNDIYLSTIFNACEEKVLTYDELLQKVNLYIRMMRKGYTYLS